jgi:uncharacterized protein
MEIWIDGDACPGDAKLILFRAAERRKITTTLVANQPMTVPRSDYLKSVRVSSGLDEADRYIVEKMASGDLVITSDIPLAELAIKRGGTVLDSRGQIITEVNIGERLALRNLLDGLRGTGMETGGPAPYGRNDKQAFANSLDRILTQLERSQ